MKYDVNGISQPQTVKKVLALHDLSCFGRCSLVPVTAVLSCMGHQCVPLPTALFSAHTAIAGWVSTDLTASISPILAHFERLELAFEAVYSGFLGTAEQIDSVAQAAGQRTVSGIFLVDPVMADNGAVYQTYTPEMTLRMRELCKLADVITPNTTEAAILLGFAPDTPISDRQQAEEWCTALHEQYGARVVLTGLELHPGEVTIACCASGKTEFAGHDRLGGFYPGTGDIFASVLLGGLLCGDALTESAVRAGTFVRECIHFTAARGTNPLYGVLFEPLLHMLSCPRGV